MAVKPDKNTTSVAGRAVIIALRLAVGITFIVSGWAKSIDPWGFVYKIEEYLNVWGNAFPRELTLTAAVSLSVAEFTVGILILFGALRRGALWMAAAFMSMMLPLTVYIAIANPVSDCGCFGDFVQLSNNATLAKNIVLTLLIIILLKYNTRIKGLYEPGIQWLVVVGAIMFSLALAFCGYRYQPLVDFRPYPTGSTIFSDEASSTEEEHYIYTRDGLTQSFTLDALPDSTWTYVRTEIEANDDNRTLSISDGDEDVTSDILTCGEEMLLLAVPDPGIHYLTRARLANELSSAIAARGGRMVALVAADGENLDGWRQLALPSYEVYTSEDTSLKELVRGDAGLLYINPDGTIVWKRNLSSIRHDTLRNIDDVAEFFSGSMAVDDGKLNLVITAIFVLWLVVVYTLNFPNRILDRYFERRSQKKS